MTTTYTTPATYTMMMTELEARQKIDKVKTLILKAEAALHGARKTLMEFYAMEGWRALGYHSFSQCIQAEFGKSKSTVYNQLAAAICESDLSTTGGTWQIPERVLRNLTKFNKKPEVQRMIWDIAVTVAGAENLVTSTTTKKVVEVLSEAVVTGMTSDDEGNQSPVWQNIRQDVLSRVIESNARKQEIISGDRKVFSAIPAILSLDDQNNAILHIQGQLQPEQLKRLLNGKFRVSAWMED